LVHFGLHGTHRQVNVSHKTVLRMIAAFKLVKAALLIAVALGSLKLIHRDVGDTVTRWAQAVGLDASSQSVNTAVEKASSLTPANIKALSFGSLLYAALFLTEGIGLALLKSWAEWLTIIITCSFLPLEIYEIVRHSTWLRALVFAINIGIAAYLIYNLRTKRAK
jgi:uncharacterized membrane protein (DUF2068 family)